MSSLVTVRRLLRNVRTGGVRLIASSFHRSAVTSKQQKILAICREEYNAWERRAPLSPAHVQTLTREGVRVRVGWVMMYVFVGSGVKGRELGDLG